MKKQASPDLRVRFTFFSERENKQVTEELLVTLLDKFAGFYVLDSVPEHVPGVASDDVICARFDKKEKVLLFSHIIQHSGNSVLRLQLKNSKEDFKAIREMFTQMGCFSEKSTQFFFSMEVPAELSYGEIKAKLEDLKAMGTIVYTELFLSGKHSGKDGTEETAG